VNVKLRKLNDWIGEKLAYYMSTMICFYLITMMVVLPLLWQRPTNLVGWMQYLISVFFQGVALPVLGYVSRVAGEKQERVLQETHDAVLQELAELKEIHKELCQKVDQIAEQKEEEINK
jgi:hypothetical protein